MAAHLKTPVDDWGAAGDEPAAAAEHTSAWHWQSAACLLGRSRAPEGQCAMPGCRCQAERAPIDRSTSPDNHTESASAIAPPASPRLQLLRSHNCEHTVARAHTTQRQPTLVPSRAAQPSSGWPTFVAHAMWRRLPAYLPNISLKLQPLSEAQQAVFEKTGFLRELVFKTPPSVSKVRPPWRPGAQPLPPPPPPATRRAPPLALDAAARRGSPASTHTPAPTARLRSRPSWSRCTACRWPRSTR